MRRYFMLSRTKKIIGGPKPRRTPPPYSTPMCQWTTSVNARNIIFNILLLQGCWLNKPVTVLFNHAYFHILLQLGESTGIVRAC